MRIYKHHILYIIVVAIIFILSLVFIENNSSSNNVSALSYESSVGIGFTFNPTLSISLSSNDLVISNLVPGSSSDSNSINVSVATNAAYGYNLSASVGNSTYNNTNLTSKDNNVFTNIPTTANLSNLNTDNTWGYSYSLDNGTTWSSYSGLPLYSNSGSSSNNSSSSSINNSGSKTLIDKYSQSEDMVNFKIAAKASSTQPSGIYSNVINFNVVSYASPMSLSDSYAYFGKELYHGYYKMQDMTTRICQTTEAPSELQVIDIRDDKVYWIAKLADNNCWMTQNLDLCIGCENVATLTSENTDLNESGSGAYVSGYSNADGIITWEPTSTAVTSNHPIDGNSVTGWLDRDDIAYSAEGGDVYYYTNNLNKQWDLDLVYNSMDACVSEGHAIGECLHYHAGNYYNYTTAIASNRSYHFATQYAVATNSICPVGWRLPKGAAAAEATATTHEFSQLLYVSNITMSLDSNQYATDGFINIRRAPLYFVRSGGVWAGEKQAPGYSGRYGSSTIRSGAYLSGMDFERRWGDGSDQQSRNFGISIRCLAR